MDNRKLSPSIRSSIWEEIFSVFFGLAALAWLMSGGGLIYVIYAFVDNVLWHKIISIPFSCIGWFIQIMLWINAHRNRKIK